MKQEYNPVDETQKDPTEQTPLVDRKGKCKWQMRVGNKVANKGGKQGRRGSWEERVLEMLGLGLMRLKYKNART